MKPETEKKVILTYHLEEAQTALLQKTLQSLKSPAVIASAEDIESVFAFTPFMAFINFTSLGEAEEQAFFAAWQKQAQKSLLQQLGKRKMPLTYILNCKTVSDKVPHLFVNRDIFADQDKLRLTLLQEIKAVEVNKPSEPYSDRLKRILRMYCKLLYEGCLKHDSVLSKRRFYQDMSIIKLLIPDVKYDRIQDKYITQYLAPNFPAEEEIRKALLASKLPVRLKRVLLICQQLLCDGWVTKEVTDTLGMPVSLRMFQRDLTVIDKFVTGIAYDMDQRKYVLAARISQERSSSRVRRRNDDWRV